jgi:hypothetical protein
MVVCNEAHRLEPLLRHLRPHFDTIIIGVQESTDGTESIVDDYADVVVADKRSGYGDSTVVKLQRRVNGRWCFRVDADEWPTDDLLERLPAAVEYAETHNLQGLWLPFRSWIEDVEWKVPHSHLRLWRNNILWPPALHSRPMTENTQVWHTGFIEHRKSLSEHITGYLGYWDAGRGNVGWETHNAVMMEAACRGSAERYGWGFVQSFDWWPEVRRIAFHDKDPHPAESITPEP